MPPYTPPTEYTDEDSIDYDEDGNIISCVIIGYTWADVAQYHLDKISRKNYEA